MKIAILSDNHGYLGDDVLEHVHDVNQIWHAGDIGTFESIEPLLDLCEVRAVYGNVDGHELRAEFPLNQIFEAEGLKVFMTHIGGYPGRYNKRVYELLNQERPDIYVCGHSHICKVMRDDKLNLLHINPGAYGHHGFHKFRTLIKMDIENSKISDLKVVELGLRGKIK